MDSRLEKQLAKEIDAINRTLAGFDVNAGCRLDKTIVGGDQLIIYRMGKADSVRISDIEKVIREISEAVSRQRKQTTFVRLLTSPLRLEVTHPFRQPLAWNSAALTGDGFLGAHALLLGRTYDRGERDLWLPFNHAPHVLVAGTTGAGKSVELANMLLGLCWNTSPADLRIVLIDMKNTDLVPFARLPHVEMLATDLRPAFNIFREAGAILKQRQTQHINTPRLLIVVDEYTDLIGDADAMSHVDRIARQGRSANMNLLVATQHPTSKALGGSIIKNNFANRVVGLVADANAASNAAGRPGTHAELLPGKGAFLWINGPDTVRFQSYLLTDIDMESLITRVWRKWSAESFDKVLRSSSSSSSSPANRVFTRVQNAEEVREEPFEEPFEELSEEPEEESVTAMARRIVNAGMVDASKNAISTRLFGKSYGGAVWPKKLNSAIAMAKALSQQQTVQDNKIIRLRRTGTGGD